MPANQMLDQMLKPGSEAPKPIARPAEAAAVDRTSGSSAVAPGAETLTVIREGTYLVDRTGRLTKGADGQYEFSFEADGKAMKDPPVLILPNLKLMAMETAVSAANRDLHFRITGVVTEYKQRNYVLLEKVVVIPETVQNF